MVTIEFVRCPMLKKDIDVAYCIELQMIAGQEITPTEEEIHLTKEDYDICLKCKKQEFPIPDITLES